MDASGAETRTDTLREQCRQALDAERAELQLRIDRLNDDPGERDDGVGDVVRDRLREVEDALARLRHGTFGTCESCRTSIAEARLVAQPAVRHCESCSDARSSVITSSPDVE